MTEPSESVNGASDSWRYRDEPTGGETAENFSTVGAVGQSAAAPARVPLAGRGRRVRGIGWVSVGGLTLTVVWISCVLLMMPWELTEYWSWPEWVSLCLPVSALLCAVLALIWRNRLLVAVAAGFLVLTVVHGWLSINYFYGWPFGASYWLGVPVLFDIVVWVLLAVLCAAGISGIGARQQVSDSGRAGQGATGRSAYASWGSRVGAALLDGIPAGLLYVVGVVVIPATMTEASAGSHGRYTAGGPSAVGIVVMVACWLGGLAYLIWNVGFNQGRTGQTWGKRVVGISVIAEQTRLPLGVGASIGRQLAHIVDALPCYLGFLFPLWDAKSQTFADKMLHSIVITGRAEAQHDRAPTTSLPPGDVAYPSGPAGTGTPDHQQRIADLQTELDLLRQINAERDKLQ
ncbi:proline-rich antigen-like protein [Mycobacteroides abscessus subsp. abscessus]|uniref:RDD family protein n=1 Tax=Mycobacteroides abscessus TaxID=36809 RepID=UPI00092B7E11|nr:RDD family protein [Mycobacteroides abscessus]SIM03627.1 proline-rich antigen-like protein [Mycobacteroides abscessus subsp. abscessus]SLC78171.1 proline-rich antigen-like protein [Mycobacteroides abscessus subsp. abscessus]